MSKLKFDLLQKRADEFSSRITDEKLKRMFKKCFINTLETTVQADGEEVYVITGDINAMWLRDSSAQVMQYLEFVDGDEQVAQLIKKMIKRQMRYIKCDPYANAFNYDESVGFGWKTDVCEQHPIVHERKFELDSLCYPLLLACRYYEKTNDATVFSADFVEGINIIAGVFEVESDHKNSPYYHYRPTEEDSFSVPNKGKGGGYKKTGLIWSGYRPSDDPCIYGYFIPGNMMVSVVFHKLIELSNTISTLNTVTDRLNKIVNGVDKGLAGYAIVNHNKYGKMYAFETDGLGNYNLMDDANVPSLLSLPYLGYCNEGDELYQNTRKFILSCDNPYYFKGKVISGVGSPHTPKGYVWHIGLIMEGLTTSDSKRINEIVDTLLSSDAGTDFMHEGVHCDDDKVFTRSWFAWANSLMSYFVLKKQDQIRYIK